MKCLTIRQPWATLIALGEKQIETRTWRTAHRGELAIHAGMQVNKAICRTEPFQSLLARHGYTADNLPTGKIIAVSRIADCCEMTPGLAQQGWPGGNEYVFGNYAEGRYAWKLEEVVPLVHPIPAKGRLGFWEYPVLEEEL
ncbi:ASCH domain-containing protein [Paenibacillus sp. FSL R7-0337]|uniref:ASCH domain-containing protein n=1 Tax=unclassified Paenibacillus TaxID=185978 RepID=UPI00096D3B6F|nr:ASCH domain-containing protein [Paenibacillus sp. FSL R7-0337]OMF84513.1 2-oxoglutarate dehydrogenase E1 [Paenibacillus sp. FSL R7-0337]